MSNDQVRIQSQSSHPPPPVPTIGELKNALERVARSIVEFDQSTKQWSGFHQNGNNSIIGYAWKDYQTFCDDHIISIRGLRGLKQLINKELIWLERLAIDGSLDIPCSGSNSIYICTLWQRTMNAALKGQDPIISLDSSFPIPSNNKVASSSSSKKSQQNKPTKVDIVCESGKRWIRISTLKPIGLLSEFRSAESYISNDDDDDGENENTDDEDEDMQGSITQMNESLAKEEMDFVAKQCSIIKIVNDLDLAAIQFSKSSSFGRPSIELLLNRLPLNEFTGIEEKFYDEQEKYRFEARLKAIIKYSKLKGVEIITSDSDQCMQLYSESQSNFVIQGGGGEEICQLPKPPQIGNSIATTTLHLDLSALIACVSHISHMPLPKSKEEAELHFAKTHWKQEQEQENYSLTYEDEQNEIQPVIEQQSSNNNNEEEEDLNEIERDDRGQHSRALSEQLCREMTKDCFFEVLIRHLDESKGERLNLTCTRESFEKMNEIISLVGGEMEKRRTKYLFDNQGKSKELWNGSRWSKEGQKEKLVREKIVLPVKIIESAIEEEDDKMKQFNSEFDESFINLAERSLSIGLNTFNTRSRSSHNACAALRQTRHTITSMLTGVRNGQTVLTTNISSVKWLVRDMTRLQSHEGNSPGYRISNKEINDDQNHNKRATLWVMYPRSLSERMAITSIDESYSSQSDLQKNDLITPSEDESTKNGLRLRDSILPSLAIFNDNSFEPRGRSNRFLRYFKRFFLGPRPRSKLEIKHYRWWPLGGIERAWYKITLPLAWKDPNGKDNYHQDLTFVNDVERASILNHDKERSKNNHSDPYYDPWWRSILIDLRLNSLHWFLLTITLIGWVLGFSFLSKSLWYEGGVVNSDGVLTEDTSFFGCTSTFWLANSQCGYNGQSCSPFSSNSPVDFRCPANCQTTVLGQQRAVGDQLPAFVPLVVGGSNVSSSITTTADETNSETPFIYRADSFVCSAAIHAGIFEENKGGCGRLWLSGAYSGYESVKRFGIFSTSFNSTFPISYYFDNSVTDKDCQDNRYKGYILNTILLAFIGFILRPKQIVYFYILICVAFFHINFISEPRKYPMSVGSIFGDFLPTLFVGYALWRINYRFTFQILSKIPLESNIWLQGFFWLGTLLGVVFVNVPLGQLVAQDIAETPGALTALIVLVIVVLILAINQVRVIRKVGLLPKYLTLAIIGVIIIGLLAAVPTTGLHIHHYIIALCLIPFCAFETRLSFIYSAFLLGVFLNGVGRWSYDGIIEDTAAIIGANIIGTSIPAFLSASNYTGVYPFNSTNSITNINSTSNLTQIADSMTGLINWQPIPSNQSDQWNAFQLLIDDVLRLQANQTFYDLGNLANNFIAFNQTSSTETILSQIELSNLGANYSIYPGGQESNNILNILINQPHYLRLAYYNSINGNLGDFTEAATVWFNGTFISPLDGAT